MFNTKIYNKGIPTVVGIMVSTEDIKKYCVPIDKHKMFDEAVMKYAKEFFNKDNAEDLNQSEFIFEAENKKTKTVVKYYNAAVINTIFEDLNLDGLITLDTKKSNALIRKKIQKLERVRTIEELRKEFPYLANKYLLLNYNYLFFVKHDNKVHNNKDFAKLNVNFQRILANRSEKLKSYSIECNEITNQLAREKSKGEKANQAIINMLNKDMDNVKDQYSMQLFQEANDFFKGIKFTSSIRDYVIGESKGIKNLYESFTQCMNDAKNDIIINMDEFEGIIDENRFELYYAARILSNLKATDNFAIENLSYLSAYFKEPDYEEEISIDYDFNKIIKKPFTKASLYEEYKEYIFSHPNVPIITVDSDKFKDATWEDVKEYLKLYKMDDSTTLDWEILPASKGDGVAPLRIKNYKDGTKAKEQYLRQKKIYDEKVEFFSQQYPELNYNDASKERVELLFSISGCNHFEGYRGYVYNNGVVLLEKLYENEKTGNYGNNAIYILSCEEFIELSKYEKRELIELGKKRIIHRNDWQGKTLKVLAAKSVTIESIQNTQLIKNYRVKNR